LGSLSTPPDSLAVAGRRGENKGIGKRAERVKGGEWKGREGTGKLCTLRSFKKSASILPGNQLHW